eukprot:4209497-Prymnesium_polylepis.1
MSRALADDVQFFSGLAFCAVFTAEMLIKGVKPSTSHPATHAAHPPPTKRRPAHTARKPTAAKARLAQTARKHARQT